MIKVNLILSKYLTEKENSVEEGKCKAANSIRELLSQIDYKAEVVPENSLDMFTRLLLSLKGEPLDKNENELIEEIINY